MAGRWVDLQPCSVRDCHRPIEADDEAVVFATHAPALKQLQKAQAGAGVGAATSTAAKRRRGAPSAPARVEWVAGRQAAHRACWDAFVTVKDGLLSQPEQRLRAKAIETVEFYDGRATLKAKAVEAAGLISKGGVVAFTGAGISVNAGIPDYRGTAGIDTQAELGQRQGTTESASDTKTKRKAEDSKHAAAEEDEEDSEGDVDYTKLVPTITHKALVDLERRGLLTYTVTQNCDGLHLRAGTARDHLSELHGNVFVEVCEVCRTEFVRDFEVDAYSTGCYLEPYAVKCQYCGWNHYTGNKCTAPKAPRGKCGGRLRDTIVNFSDPLFATTIGGLANAVSHFDAATCCLVLGSSLTVSPANNLVMLPEHVIVCNLQVTEADDRANVRVWGDCDAFFTELMAVLGTAAAVGAMLDKTWRADRGRKAALTELQDAVQYARECAAAPPQDPKKAGKPRQR